MIAPGPLRHNINNPITAVLECVEPDVGPAYVRKVLRGDAVARHPDWVASADRRSWAWWRREAELMAAGLHRMYAPEGLQGPEVLRIAPDGVGGLEIRMRCALGRSGADLTQSDLVEVAERLGAAQGRLAGWPVPWSGYSRGFLRDHVASKHVDPRWLDDARACSHPLVASTWPADLIDGLRRLWSERETLVRIVERGPRTSGHLDLWSENLIKTRGGWVVLDWACAGSAALGEDVSNLVFEASLDELLPASELPDLAERAIDAYLVGVRSSGWSGDLESVRTVAWAATVKWCWMGPLHLQRAVEGGHHRYGGDDDPDPAGQYLARGRTLAEAVRLADAALARLTRT